MAYVTHGLDLKNGLALKAAGLIAADTNSDGVTVGRGFYLCKIAWTASEIVDNDELYNIVLEANTVAADTTWDRLGGGLLAGATEVNGGAADIAASGEVVFGVFNPKDYQMRVATFVNGTIATGMNFSVTLYPVNQAPF
jgi:hypothetical protein